MGLVHEALNFLVRLYWTKSNYLEFSKQFDYSLQNYDFCLAFIT